MRCLQGRLSAGNLEIISGPGLNRVETLRLTRRTLRGLSTRRRLAASPSPTPTPTRRLKSKNNNNGGGSIMRRVGDGPISCHRTNKSITNHISVAVNHQRLPGAQDPPPTTTSPGPSPHTPPLHFASSSLHKTHGDKQLARGDRQATLVSACGHVTNGSGWGGGASSVHRDQDGEPGDVRNRKRCARLRKDRKSADTAE